MFGFGKRKRKREEEQRKATEAAAAAERARLAEEMAKAEEMRKAEMAARDEAKKAAAELAVKEAAGNAAVNKPTTAKKPAVKKAAPKASPTNRPATAEVKTEPVPTRAANANGKFEIKRTSDGRYMFNVRAGNTQVIASSQIYSSMAACKNGIASVGANAPIAAIEDQTLQTINEEKCPKFQIYFDKAGQYRFNLIATNGNNILSCTQGYTQKSSCKNGVKSVIANATAPTEILKEEK